MKKIFYIYIIAVSFIIPASGQFKILNTEKLIASEGENFMAPVWSPDGSLIAFTEQNYKGIYVFNLRDNSIKQITDEPASGFIIKWSSDSEYILTRVAKYEGMKRYNAVKIFNVITGGEKLLSDYRTMMPGIPGWAKGDAEVFIYNRDKLEIFPSGLTKRNNQSSEKIIYKRNNKIAVEDPATESLNIFEPVKDGEVLNPAVSPDGSRVVFEIIGGNMYSMSVDGTNLIDLGIGNRPCWSPDSQYLTYMITEDDGHELTASDIFIIKYDGTGKTNITNTDDRLEKNPSWSPDGNRIVYDVPNVGAIYIMEINK